MEDYKQKYKEAIDKIKEFLKGEETISRNKLEEILPELKEESKDERIRRELINAIKSSAQFSSCLQKHGFDINEVLSWVEKRLLSENNEYILARIIEYLEDNKCPASWIDLLHDIYSLPYQKSTDCIEFNNEFENQVSHLIASVLNNEWGYTEDFIKYSSQQLLGYAKNEINKKQQSEWGDEDIRNIQDIDSVLFYDRRLPEDTRIRLRNWLKSLKDKVQPQPKQDWSEEDEKIIKRIDSLLYSQCTIHGSEYESIHNWLKSLKPNHWKPSEEQMHELRKVAFQLGNSSLSPFSDKNKELVSLYNDLKNL